MPTSLHLTSVEVTSGLAHSHNTRQDNTSQEPREATITVSLPMFCIVAYRLAVLYSNLFYLFKHVSQYNGASPKTRSPNRGKNWYSGRITVAANLLFRRKIWGARDNGIPPRSTPANQVNDNVPNLVSIGPGV